MASAIVASATTSPTSTPSTVTRSTASSTGDNSHTGSNEPGDHFVAEANDDAESDTLDTNRPVASPIENQEKRRSTEEGEFLNDQEKKEGKEGSLESALSSKIATALSSETEPSTSTKAVTTSGAKTFGEGPLPRELRRIIAEVARTGKCSWLSWNQNRNALSSSSSAAKANDAFREKGSAARTNAQKSPSSPYGAMARKQSPFAGSTTSRRSTGLPPRKRHRNGVKGGERLRFENADGAFGRSSSSTTSRKRPLVHTIHNTGEKASSSANSSSNSAPNSLNSQSSIIASQATGLPPSSAPSSVGSGSSTANEPDYDSAPYECDSEGTSATTNSEISGRYVVKGIKRLSARAQLNNTLPEKTTREDEEDQSGIPGSPYKSLQIAFRGALGLVLDHFYKTKDNRYKLSPAEKRRNDRFAETVKAKNGNSMMKSDKLETLLSSEYVFQQRRQRLMAMLLPSTHPNGHGSVTDQPPFTIQRIAEVLLAPDRYYTQTHKLCNCLEKLLLVNSSTESFGGSTGGNTSQRRSEDREIAALADEKGRQEFRLRQRRLANRKSPLVGDLLPSDQGQTTIMADSCSPSCSDSSEQESSSVVNRGEAGTVEASHERIKEEVGNHSSHATIVASGNITSNTGRTDSYPTVAKATATNSTASREALESLARKSLRSKFDNDTTELQQTSHHQREVTDLPPLNNLNVECATNNVSSHGDVNGYPPQQHFSETSQSQNPNQSLVGRAASPIMFSSGNDANVVATASNLHMLQLHHAVALTGASLNRSSNPPTLDNLMAIDANTISQMRSQVNAIGTGPGSESTDGRSSASNSDIDSESDDISFDDSASDRSDGSDSGSMNVQHHEPFTAARAMALNRMQQQQRMLHTRMMTSLGVTSQLDSEYQSGDSIDSTRAEDSGGSDSSSSDIAE